MALTTLDAKSALVVIDLQKGIVGYPTVHPIAGVVRNAHDLAVAFRRKGLPVVLVNVAGVPPGRVEQRLVSGSLPPDFAELVPELDQQASDILITKKTPGAFSGTALEARLTAAGATQVVIAGVSTSMGVEMTARQAFELGFNVALAVDAMTDVSAEAHAHSVARTFPRLGESGTTQEIIALLGDA